MRMERINESQVRCVISKEDLTARHLTLQELKYGSQETSALFHEMMAMASEKYKFNEDELPIMVEAIPINPEELLLIISVVEDADELDPHFVRFSQRPEEVEARKNETAEKLITETAPEQVPDVVILAFGNIDEVVTLAKAAGLSYPGETVLYQDEETHCFYLVLKRGEKMEPLDFIRCLNNYAEYGNPVNNSPRLYAYLREHQKPVMEHPLLTLFFA